MGTNNKGSFFFDIPKYSNKHEITHIIIILGSSAKDMKPSKNIS